jgi:hypothetical protein
MAALMSMGHVYEQVAPLEPKTWPTLTLYAS